MSRYIKNYSQYLPSHCCCVHLLQPENKNIKRSASGRSKELEECWEGERVLCCSSVHLPQPESYRIPVQSEQEEGIFRPEGITWNIMHSEINYCEFQ